MGSYSIDFARSARKELMKLPPAMAERVDAAILKLADDPHPPGRLKLAGDESAYRIRVGDYRIIYEIRNEVLVVLIVTIGHRKDLYR